MNGLNQDGSSNKVARRLTRCSNPSGLVNAQLMQYEQKWWRGEPRKPPMTVSPRRMEKPLAGTRTLTEKALPVIR